MKGSESKADEQAEQQQFMLLDSYLERLQSGDAPSRAELLRDHPDLAGAAQCLDMLEELAWLPPTPSPATGAPTHEPSQPAGATLDFALQSSPLLAQSLHGQAGRTELGDFELLDEVGRGGMGVVYRARQKSLDRSVAIKMILSSHLASEDQVRRFQAEAKAAAGLSHPNIVNVYEVGVAHGQHYFAMQYVPGRSLAQWIAADDFDLQAGLRLLVPIARAVDHLHRHGILHRDLKPSNILIDPQGQPFVTDFGLAKVFAGDSQQTATGFIAGTPSYMAPEQAWPGSAPIGPACDIYSLGAILYELLTGQPPFREESALDTLLSVRSREPTLPRQLNPRVPSAVEVICLKCLEKDPRRRYASAAALADDLEHYFKGEQLEARPPHGLHRLTRWARRQPALALRLATFAIFLTILVVHRYLMGLIDDAFFLPMAGIIGVGTATSVLFQQLLKRELWPTTTIFAWAAVDVMLLTGALNLGGGVISPMVFSFPMLIVGSGLWFRVRLVWFMVAMSLLSYASLVADLERTTDPAALSTATDPVRHIMFVVMAIIIGAGVSYQVARTRALSQYYEQRRPG
jgi:serine/threonine-protein kinase